MHHSTRQRILEYLQKEQTASVRELSRALSLTGANIRHHLSILLSNQQVDVAGHRIEPRGRPVQLYSLSRRVLGEGLDVLADRVLDEWFESMDEVARRRVIRSIARRLMHIDQGIQNAPLSMRLSAVVEGVNRLHYLARWEAAATGPKLVFGNCPYAAIIQAHPELCQMDADLLEHNLKQSIRQTVKLQRSAKGLPFCEFLVGQEDKAR